MKNVTDAIRGRIQDGARSCTDGMFGERERM